VTIAYTTGTPTLWDLCCGRVGPVRVDVQRRPIEGWLSAGNYSDDPVFRQRFQSWLSSVWAEKDARLDRLLT